MSKTYAPPATVTAKLPQAIRPAGHSRSLAAITKIVVHVDGVARRPQDPELEPIVRAARYHMDKDWRGAAQKTAGGPPVRGDGLQYHYAIGANGTIYEARPLTTVLWHANNANSSALAIMLPCGFNQEPTPAQLASLEHLLVHLTEHAPEIPAARKDVFGHGELTSYGNKTPCPGGALLKWVQAFRNGKA